MQEYTSYTHICESVLNDYLSTIDTDCLPEPSDTEETLLNALSLAIHERNAGKEREDKWRKPKSLPPAMVADMLISTYHIYSIQASSEFRQKDYDMLAMYVSEGENAGIYIPAGTELKQLVSKYMHMSSLKDIDTALELIRINAPRKVRCMKPSLIPVNNGIFDYDKKILMPFDPELVFLSKSYVDYNPSATNITIHNDKDDTDWDVESWMNELSDDPEIINLLWEIIGAVVRPNAHWNKSAWFYSEKGNNGKGTLCKLMRNICGSPVSISLDDFSKDFRLESLPGASAIIVDENDVGTFIDKAANLKAIVTGDIITINRKFKTPIAYQFLGFMVQCINEFPRVKDKSDSFYRRQLFVPFEKCFTGIERKYIKNDYLNRKEVLEYVLYKVLNMDYYELSEPESCKQTLNEYKEFNDPLRQFFNEIVCEQCVWDLLPFSFLYDLYKAWFKDSVPQGALLGRNKFIQEICILANQSEEWYCFNKNQRVWTKNLMDTTEPLIIKYGLADWTNTRYKGSDIDKICDFDKSESYRGLQRTQTIATPFEEKDENNND